MEKAYDFKDLGSRLKDKGLVIAEEAAEVIVEETLEWITESAKVSENKYDDMIVAVVPLLRDKINESVDKIDGKEG